MDPQQSYTQPDEHTYVGDILREPLYTDIVRPSYSLRVRPIYKPAGRTIRSGAAQVILASGEAVSVNVIGFGSVHPMPEAVKSGAWTPDDETIFIAASDLTPEQAQQARRFVQRQDDAS